MLPAGTISSRPSRAILGSFSIFTTVVTTIVISITTTLFGATSHSAESPRISIPKTQTSNLRPAARMQTSFLSPKDFQANVSGQSLTHKDQIFRTLLAGDGHDLTWPAFPRTWHEQSVSTMINSNTALGFAAAGIGGAVSIDFKWALKTSIILIATNRRMEVATDTNDVAIDPVSDPMQFELFTWDEATRRALPKVSPEYPMVALCAFEASLNYSETARGGVSFVGSGQTVEGGMVRTVSHTMFSRFFQLDGKRSAMQVLNEVCGGTFRESVEKHANLDFSRTVTELFAYHHRANQCAPSSYDTQSRKGDASCFEWHRKKYPSVLRQMTVPRCEIGRTGHYRCVAKSKFQGSCPMHWNPETKTSQVPDRMSPRRWPIKATGSALEFDCDTTSGLTCQMVREPLMALGIPFWRGKARCIPKSWSI